jgi:hypothetical protein
MGRAYRPRSGSSMGFCFRDGIVRIYVLFFVFFSICPHYLISGVQSSKFPLALCRGMRPRTVSAATTLAPNSTSISAQPERTTVVGELSRTFFFFFFFFFCSTLNHRCFPVSPQGTIRSCQTSCGARACTPRSGFVLQQKR